MLAPVIPTAFASTHYGAHSLRAGRETLEFWAHWGSAQRRPVIQHIVDQFNQSQTKYYVDYQFEPFGAGWTKELAAVAAGDPPDVIIQDINTVAVRAERKQNVNLASFLKKDNLQSEFYPNLWKAMLYKGNAYGLPFNTDTRILFYNKTMFAAAGIKNPPATWAELDADAKKLDVKNPDGSYKTIGFYPMWGSSGTNIWELNADGGQSYLNVNTGKVTINTPNKLAALQWINSYNKRLGLNNIQKMQAQFGNGIQDGFVAGKVAMWANTPTAYTSIRDYAPANFSFGVAPLPAFKAGAGNWSWGGGFDVEIPYGAKDPAGSFTFMKFLTGTWAQEYWAAHEFDTVGNVAAAQQASNDPLMVKDSAMVYKAAIANMKWTVLTPDPWYAPGYADIINPTENAAANGQMDPKRALQKEQQAVEQLIQSVY